MLNILGLGHAHPENRITNAFLEQIGVAEEAWILQRVGIAERRSALPLEYIRSTLNADPRAAFDFADAACVELTRAAVRLALDRAGIGAGDIGMVIGGSSAPQFASPAQSSRLAAALEMEVPAFDAASACSTFALHTHLAASLSDAALPEFTLLLQPELMTAATDYRDRNTAVLFGDCVTAAVVSRIHPGRLQVQQTVFHGTPSQWKKIQVPAGSHVRMDGIPVQGYAVRQTAALFKSAAASMTNPVFIGHQASGSILQSVCRISAIAQESHWFNIDRFGNCGSAGAPSVLSEHWNDLVEGVQVVAVVVGAGLSSGSVSLCGMQIPDVRRVMAERTTYA